MGCRAVVLLAAGWGNLVNTAVLGFLAVNLVLGVANLVPVSRSVPNDGTILREAMRSPSGWIALGCQMRFNAEMARGKTLGEIDRELFDVCRSPASGNFHVATLSLL